jgi:hypothetical protein
MFLCHLKNLSSNNFGEALEKSLLNRRKLPVISKSALKKNPLHKVVLEPKTPISKGYTETSDLEEDYPKRGSLESDMKNPSSPSSKVKSPKKIAWNLPEKKKKSETAHMSSLGSASEGLNTMIQSFTDIVSKSDNWISVHRGDKRRERTELIKKVLMSER